MRERLEGRDEGELNRAERRARDAEVRGEGRLGRRVSQYSSRRSNVLEELRDIQTQYEQWQW